MTRIGVLSDTHGYIDQPILDFFRNCGEIWHAGDIGEDELIDVLGEGRIFRGVFGNIDDWVVRRRLPEFQEFSTEKVKVLITHIGMNSGRYIPEVTRRIEVATPGIFVCGHSHILKVSHDSVRNMLHINPGAAGKSGIHRVRTAVRFEIDAGEIRNMDVWEIPR